MPVDGTIRFLYLICMRVKFGQKMRQFILEEIVRPIVDAIINRSPKPTFEGADLTFEISSTDGVTLTGRKATLTFTLSNDHADIEVHRSPLTGSPVDAEGEPVTLQQEFKTEDSAVVAIVADPADPDHFTLKLGRSGVSTVTNTVFTKVGRAVQPVKVQAATIVLTTGTVDPTTVVGGDLVFEGVDPDPETPPVV